MIEHNTYDWLRPGDPMDPEALAAFASNPNNRWLKDPARIRGEHRPSTPPDTVLMINDLVLPGISSAVKLWVSKDALCTDMVPHYIDPNGDVWVYCNTEDALWFFWTTDEATGRDQ